jgi:hypothetical protein
LEDPTRVSEDLMSKEDVDKRVRNLTKLTKEHAVADLTADFFDSVHPLPEVCIFAFNCCQTFLGLICFILCLCTLLIYSYAGSPIPDFSPSSSRGWAPAG